jgi:hypothetical protein
MRELTIDCEECVMNASSACGDCVVTYLCGEDPAEAVVVNAAEQRGLRLLGRAGLVPALRHQRRTG